MIAQIMPPTQPIEPRLASIDPQYADERASLARTELKLTIADATAVLGSARLASIMNIRNKHLAHSLEMTIAEKKNGPIQPMKNGDETELLNASIPIIERLYCWVSPLLDKLRRRWISPLSNSRMGISSF